MEKDIRVVTPGGNGTLIGEQGEKLIPPEGWEFLPAGDAGITRKVTAKNAYWRVQIKKGRRIQSKGIWAPAETIARAHKEVQTVRQTDAYKKKLHYAQQRRKKLQHHYEIDFQKAVEKFLNFHPHFYSEQEQMAEFVTRHAIPVGSGTVARTQMIALEERAAKAVIAWMRHKTTPYDTLKIPLVKGKRREVRRKFAQQSVKLLDDYRKGILPSVNCPLKKALGSS